MTKNIQLPTQKPKDPRFSPGPAKKYETFSQTNLHHELLGRSHRSNEATKFFQEIITKTKALLNIPQDYKIIIAPGSDTGAIEIAIWNLLGKIPVDCLAWDAFGYMWQHNLEHELKIPNLRSFIAPYGKYPNTQGVDFANNDVIFTLCGTTSGVVFNEFERIPNDRKGLIIADSTSFVLSKEIPWDKIDVLSFSWQKMVGGEAQHGMLVLSPRAVQRLEEFTPNRAIPQLYRLKDYEGNLKYDVLDGSPINTPSLLCVIDYMYGMDWIESQGGREFCYQRGLDNFTAVREWVKLSPWVDFLCENIENQSYFALCLKITDSRYLAMSSEEQKAFMAKFFGYLNENNIAYDIKSYKKAPLGIRLWGGTTIDTADIKALLPWLDYVFYSLIGE
ncbi:MAG: phosphoserine transaminase [Alphaproteobacteria bacterium]|jgi:phosphoserine aminotransferase|nr:phosphoserine transaminase [Alphaproteobacteria bacterium]